MGPSALHAHEKIFCRAVGEETRLSRAGLVGRRLSVTFTLHTKKKAPLRKKMHHLNFELATEGVRYALQGEGKTLLRQRRICWARKNTTFGVGVGKVAGAPLPAKKVPRRPEATPPRANKVHPARRERKGKGTASRRPQTGAKRHWSAYCVGEAPSATAGEGGLPQRELQKKKLRQSATKSTVPGLKSVESRSLQCRNKGKADPPVSKRPDLWPA